MHFFSGETRQGGWGVGIPPFPGIGAPRALNRIAPPSQSREWVSSGTSLAPADPRPDSDGFSMKNRWQLNG